MLTMPAAIRRTAMVLAVPALLGASSATATAEPDTTADYANCPSGYVCYYTGLNGTGQKCQWRNADTQHADDCSWADTTKVRSIANHGTSSAYSGVCSYRLPDYDPSQDWSWLKQGHEMNLPGGGYKVLSHRWVGNPVPVECRV
jgi:hypothetical protein